MNYKRVIKYPALTSYKRTYNIRSNRAVVVSSMSRLSLHPKIYTAVVEAKRRSKIGPAVAFAAFVTPNDTITLNFALTYRRLYCVQFDVNIDQIPTIKVIYTWYDVRRGLCKRVG